LSYSVGAKERLAQEMRLLAAWAGFELSAWQAWRRIDSPLDAP
jgi:hypothetical protein